MPTITKRELIERIADATKQSRVEVKLTVQSFLDQVIEELSKGNRLELRDFGVFETKQRAGRTAQNPKTLERVAVPPRRVVKFKVGRLLQQSLTEPEPTPAKTEPRSSQVETKPRSKTRRA